MKPSPFFMPFDFESTEKPVLVGPLVHLSITQSLFWRLPWVVVMHCRTISETGSEA